MPYPSNDMTETDFLRMYEKCFRPLCLYALHYVADTDMAEDIVQDIILELYSRRLRFNTPVALKSFLFLSVKNRALNFLRRQRAQEHYLSISVEEESFFLNNIIREEVYYHLQKMIGELSDPVRKIYELTLQEFSNEEIAEQLGLTVDSVKAHKKRGKQILKERLKGLMAFCRAKFLQPHYTPKSTSLRLFRNIAMARLK